MKRIISFLLATSMIITIGFTTTVSAQSDTLNTESIIMSDNQEAEDISGESQEQTENSQEMDLETDNNNVQSQTEPAKIIINQVYGGGGKGDTPIANSFIELFNPNEHEVNLAGYKLVYNSDSIFNLDGTIPANGSWLIIGAAEATDAIYLNYVLPDADQTWDLTINNKICNISLKYGETEIDSISTGTGSENTAVSKQKSMSRINHIDTDDITDFKIIVWEKTETLVDESFVQANAPRNSRGAYGSPVTSSDLVYTPVIASDEKIEGFYNDNAQLKAELTARYNSGAMNKDGGSLEIVAYNSANGYAYAVSGIKGKLIIINLNGDLNDDKVVNLNGTEVDISAMVSKDGFTYGDMTSVAVSPDKSKIAVALQDADYSKAGLVAVFTANANGTLSDVKLYNAGVQPDMLVFADDNTILTADEGEPRGGIGENIIDPKGSVSIINLTEETSVQVGFEGFTAQELVDKNILIGQKDGTMFDPAMDLEPEYIAVASDGKTAYISLQEANAIAVLDIEEKSITGIYSTGFANFSNIPVDLTEDSEYNADSYANLVGARMPDGISIYQTGGKTYLLTANEGDAREWGNGETKFANETKKKAFTSDNKGLTTEIKLIDANMCAGLPEGKNVILGGRSFTIFEVTQNELTEIYDSGNDFEAISAEKIADYFNVSNDDIEKDSRSPKKGPEPESVVVGEVNGKTYAFVALERIGGIMIYDITVPSNAAFVNYINSRDFSAEIQGDVSPEGLSFITNTSGETMLIAACEVSGTLAAYNLTAKPADAPIYTVGGGSSTTTVSVPTSTGTNIKATVSGTTATISKVDTANVSDRTAFSIDMSNVKKTVNSVKLPTSAVKDLTKEGSTVKTLDIKLTNGSVSFDADALKTISEDAKGNQIALNINNATSKLTTTEKNAILGIPSPTVVEVSLSSNNMTISDFKGGKAVVSVPYELKEGQIAESITTNHLDENGLLTPMETSYDAASKAVSFVTSHFSKYLISAVNESDAIVLNIGESQAKVFGETLSNDAAPKIVNDRTMLPIRFIAEKLGAKVEWLGDTRTVMISADGIEISLVIGENFATVNGEKIELDSPSFVENDRTFLPLRFVSENLGANVLWNGKTQTVIITK